MRERALLDVSDQRWVAVVGAPGLLRVVARHGGVAVQRPDGGWDWRAAPFVGAFDAVEQDGRLFVAAEDGCLHGWLDDGWSRRPIVDLERGGRLLSDGDRRWLVRAGGLFEIVGGALRARGAAPTIRGPIARSLDGVVFSDGAAVHRFRDGAFEALTPRGGYEHRLWVGVASDAQSLWLVDETGTLSRLRAGRVEELRRGYITHWKRHTYPDPEPDDYDDRVMAAAIAADGEVATWRFYDHGSERYWELSRIPLDGEGRRSRWTGSGGDLELRAASILAFDRDLPEPPPAATIAALDPPRVALAVGDERAWARARAGDAEPGTRRLADGPVRYLGETWRGVGATLRIEGVGEPVEVALGAPWKSFLVLEDRPPIAIDETGAMHRFDGAAFHVTPLETKLGAGRHLAVVANGLWIADATRLLEIPIVDSRRAPIRDPESLSRHLSSGLAPLVVRRVPIAREVARRSMHAFEPRGRTAAGIALAALFGGEDDAPGPPDHASLAASVMLGFGSEVDYYTLDVDGVTVAWVALLEDHAVVATSQPHVARVAAALRGA